MGPLFCALTMILKTCLLCIQLTKQRYHSCSLCLHLHLEGFASSNPGRSGWRIFFSRVNFVCWLLFGVHSTPVLLQWHVKDPGHSAKSAVWQVTPKHAYTLDPTKSEWADYAASKRSVGTYPETSSLTTCQGTFGHNRLSWATVDWRWHKEWN